MRGGGPAQFESEDTQAVCEQLGLAYYEKVCLTRAECIAAVEEYNKMVTLVILGTNRVNIENAGHIVTAAGKIPVVSYAKDAVFFGALGAFAADLAIIGQLLAESVVEVLVDGKAISEVPIKMDPNPEFVLNVSTAERLGIEIPYNILRAATLVE